MQKIENKFIYFILILLVFIIWFSIYISVFKKAVDRSSYVQLIQWEAYVNDIYLIKDEKHKLNLNDIIKTTKEESLAIIEWWDWSVTRLWWNTSVKVNELFVSDNKEKLNISFELLNWKTWSNVVSFVPEDSYFKETFADTEAAVRWTVFNVDLEKDYLYVIDHKVELTKQWWDTIQVDEKKPISISSFSFIQLDEFIKNIRDNAFDKLNRDFDLELLNNLKIELESKINNLLALSNAKIDDLSIEDKTELYNELLASYQELNFVSSSDGTDLYNLKLSIKEKLLNVAPETQKTAILDSFIYDLKDSISSKSYDSLDWILTIINDNSQYVEIKEQLLPYLESINLWDNVKTSLINNINTFKTTFWDKLQLNPNQIIEKKAEIENKAQDILNNFINN